MFDIGFWEIIMVGVVALLVIGPKELPTMMRTVGRWMGKTRHFVNAVKTEIEREAYRADELKRLLAEQAGIVERHKNIDTSQPAVPPKPSGNVQNNPVQDVENYKIHDAAEHEASTAAPKASPLSPPSPAQPDSMSKTMV